WRGLSVFRGRAVTDGARNVRGRPRDPWTVASAARLVQLTSQSFSSLIGSRRAPALTTVVRMSVAEQPRAMAESRILILLAGGDRSCDMRGMVAADRRRLRLLLPVRPGPRRPIWRAVDRSAEIQVCRERRLDSSFGCATL